MNVEQLAAVNGIYASEIRVCANNRYNVFVL